MKKMKYGVNGSNLKGIKVPFAIKIDFGAYTTGKNAKIAVLKLAVTYFFT